MQNAYYSMSATERKAYTEANKLVTRADFMAILADAKSDCLTRNLCNAASADVMAASVLRNAVFTLNGATFKESKTDVLYDLSYDRGELFGAILNILNAHNYKLAGSYAARNTLFAYDYIKYDVKSDVYEQVALTDDDVNENYGKRVFFNVDSQRIFIANKKDVKSGLFDNGVDYSSDKGRYFSVCLECGEPIQTHRYWNYKGNAIHSLHPKRAVYKDGRDGYVCSHCADIMSGEGGRFEKCADCGTLYEDGLTYMQKYKGRFYCADCVDSHFVTCENCGELMHCDDAIQAYNYRNCSVYFCDDCVDENTFICACCGERYTNDADTYETGDGETICSDCRDEYYVHCACCDELYHRDNMHYHNGEYYCADCAADFTSERINGYHTHKRNRTKFIIAEGEEKTDATAFIGVEQETDDGEHLGAYVEELYGELQGKATFEEDSSLSCGVEIITEAHTRKALEAYPFERIQEIARKYNFKAHDTDTCGLHVHFSRCLFGDDSEAQANTISRLIAIFDIFAADIQKIARREYNHYAYAIKLRDKDAYCGSDIEKADEAAKDTYEGEINRSSRYGAINLTNEHTIEFRLCKGTINAKTIRATIDFLYDLVTACRDLPISEFYGGDDSALNNINIKRVLDNQGSRAIAYIKERKAFTCVYGG